MQGVNIDFGKALNLLDAALDQLSKLIGDTQNIIQAVEENFDGIKWEERDGCQVSFPKMNLQSLQKNSGNVRYPTQLLIPLLPEYMNVFLVDDKFYRRLLFFTKSDFHIFEVYPTITGHVEENVRNFCKTYKIDFHCCAVELCSFPTVFKLFDFDIVANKTDQTDYGDDSDEFSGSTKDTNGKYGVDMQDKDQTFVDCLSVLTSSRYKLIDVYSTLVRVYSLALAIPITSSSAEHLFSTLKCVKP